MSRSAAHCDKCGKDLVPEEIEVGISLVCPRCNKKRVPSARNGAKDAGAPKSSSRRI
jgi:DNA-directed RNA polymerase subunit RPC12/RpoP